MTADPGAIYVTGTAGMIGSNLSLALLEAGHKVIGVDNLWRGTTRNLEQLKAFPNFVYRHADIAADQDWYADMGADSVLFHTADIVAGIGYVFSNEWRVFQKNILINTQVARIVNHFQPRQLIYLGTACSYPQTLQRSVESSVLSEKVKFPADPESGYGWSKLIGEIEFNLAVKDTRTRLTVLDLHNVYGWPCIYADSTSQVIPSLIFKALTSADRKLNVWGDGKQGRAFLHVRDVIDGALRAIGYEGDARTFMLGPDHCTSIGEVAQLIVKHPKVRIDEIVYDTSKPIGDIGRFADPSLARQELGWSESVVFEEGLHELIDNIVEDRARNA
ncbi:NAD-dependent epimerase/dehydratase family protein [Allosphingosinicella sp.]|uniref:NAD-dependent epimerase/dehydratase family protein n=1 Tax=Allosphingosinicella sp. TaxID=2823234 RepID=UPI0037834993